MLFNAMVNKLSTLQLYQSTLLIIKCELIDLNLRHCDIKAFTFTILYSAFIHFTREIIINMKANNKIKILGLHK